jgi:DNA-binding response OmpR family regulator
VRYFAPSCAPTGMEVRSVKTVLLVDDEASLRILVRTTLEDSSCRVLEAHDGKMALAIARRESPDLILLDWTCPA